MSNEQHGRTQRRSLGAAPSPSPMAAGVRVALPSRLDVECVTRLYQLLSPLANHTAPVVVVASEVTHVHAAALRVLAAFFRVRATGGDATVLRNPSEPLRTGAQHCGVAADLGLGR
jgi:anti-anti-sigma regulatory factor